MSKLKNRGREARTDYGRKDFHHFLYQARHWGQGYAKALRQHPFCGDYIPQATLHRSIHAKLHDVPVPNGKDCRRVLNELDARLKAGELSFEMKASERVSWLAEQFSNCPATSVILQWESDLLRKGGY